MTVKIHPASESLYEEDFYLWLFDTAQKLRKGRFDEVDVDNLIEEIECMGRSERRSLESFLQRLIEHLLKLSYWDSERERNQNHWKGEINNFRREIEALLKDSPSLNTHLQEFFQTIYPKIAKTLKSSFEFSVPSECPFTLEEVLEPNWFPIRSETQEENS